MSARLATRVGLMALLASCAGCGGPQAVPLPDGGCFVGELAAAPELQLVYRTVDGTVEPVTNDAALPLIEPPQGGMVMLVGAKARNIDGCSLLMATSLRVPGGGPVLAFERRPVTLQPTQPTQPTQPMSDGWLLPARPALLSNYSNLPACPVAGFDRAIAGQTYELEVRIEDAAGRHAEATAAVVPTCAQPELQARCMCQCAANYTLGSTCP